MNDNDLNKIIKGANNIGHSLLCKLYDFDNWLKKRRPVFLSDKKFERVNKNFLKQPIETFPIDKMGPYMEKPEDIYMSIEPWFYLLIDIMEFQPICMNVLSVVTTKAKYLDITTEPTLTSNFMNLLVTYVKLILLLEIIEEKKLIIYIFGLLNRVTRQPAIDAPKKLFEFINRYEKRWKQLREDFHPLSHFIGKTLSSIYNDYTSIKTTSILRNDGHMSVVKHPSLSKNYEPTEVLNCKTISKVNEWVIFGFMVCLEGLAVPNALDFLKFVLEDGFNISIFGEKFIQIFPEVISSFKSSKSKLIKLVKHVNEIKNKREVAFESSGIAHKNMRNYLAQCLRDMVNLFTDSPIFLGPKIEMVLTLLSLVKQELVWFFYHQKRYHPKKVKHPNTFKDSNISELIFNSDKMFYLVHEYQKDIKDYYKRNLQDNDLYNLQNRLGHHFFYIIGDNGSEFVTELIEVIENDNEEDFEYFRNRWLEIEGSMLEVEKDPQTFNVNLRIITNTLRHTEYIDNLIEILHENCSLRELWYFKEDLLDIFVTAISDSPDQPTHVISLLSLCGQFYENAIQYDPLEPVNLKKDIVQFAEYFMKSIIDRIRELFREISHHYTELENSLKPMNAMYVIDLKKNPDSATQFQYPGDESQFDKRSSLRSVQLYQRNISQLCFAINQFDSVEVGDVRFNPKAYLKEEIETLFSEFLSKITFYTAQRTNEKILYPPSVILKHINSYTSSLKILEDYANINIDQMVKEQLLSEVGFISPFEDKDTFISSVAKWYINMIKNSIISEKAYTKTENMPVYYNHNERTYATNSNMLPFQMEFYLSFTELKYLCSIVGSYGVKIIDEQLLEWFSENLVYLKNILKKKKKELSALQNIDFFDDNLMASIFKNTAKTQSEYDDFIKVSMYIGHILHVRSLFNQAMKEVTYGYIPVIYSSVKTAYEQYPPNLFMQDKLKGMDNLALACGVTMVIDDPCLQEQLSHSLTVDGDVWDNLGVMYSLSLGVSNYFSEKYSPQIDGYHNNLHVLIICINTLLICFKSISTGPTTRNMDPIIESLNQFVSQSANIILRLMHKPEKNTKEISLHSALILLDKFVEESPLIDRTVIDHIIPSCLFQSLWYQVISENTVTDTEQDIIQSAISEILI
eukprot:TRINITY_DN8399_c0_g1_i1.p1 TRINITY_DN8399_c0_g1~~TRINITY_DN8399_c0_g1_i1.p1  ORF type:complete len:1138 (-),score=181.51 TRINITY_DN8399_c0_g1_i1:32-3445(-)